MAKNENTYNIIAQEYEAEICEDKTVSDDSMVLSLSEGEAESIENYAGTEYIEKDIIFKESEETSPEDLISDFIGGDDDSEEAEEIYPNNITMVNGDNAGVENEENVVIGILDSGIANHDDLNVTKRVCLIPDMYVDNNLFSYDLSGHGTGVAGVIGAKNNDKGVIGIYENVELYSIQVLTPSGEAPLSRIVAGIDWAIENGVDVLNMSFGTNANSQILYDAIVRANNSGMILVAAAGNTENATQYPAKYNEVISVGSVDGSGNISNFSAKDSFVDIYAPGESVLTTSIINGYTAANGTSLAAPHVTAAAALIKATNREKTTIDIKNLISATANKSVQGNEKGILDIENMLAYADDFDYTNNQTTYQNIEPFDEYDQDAIVVGTWDGSDHRNLVMQEGTGIETQYLRLMAVSSFMADQLYPASYKDSNGNTKYNFKFYPLHAHGYKNDGERLNYNSNYFADAKYLYRVARCYMDNKLSDIDDISHSGERRNDLFTIISSDEDIYIKPSVKYIGMTDSIETRYNVHVKGIVNMPLLANNEQNNYTACAYKILGLAIHLAGDAYAHRTMIPTSSIQSDGCFCEDFDEHVLLDFNFGHEPDITYTPVNMYRYLKYKYAEYKVLNCYCYTCFRTAVGSGHVEFRDINSFYFSSDPSCEYYFGPDETYFYPERYSVATKHATETLIDSFISQEDFTLYTFVPSSSFTLKLNNLKNYMIDSYVPFDRLSENTQNRITSLSTINEV